MPGDNRARDAYDDWCIRMGGVDPDGAVLPRWEQLTDTEQRAWEGMTEGVGTAAAQAVNQMNSPTAGMYGPPATGQVEYRAGVTGPAASAMAG